MIIREIEELVDRTWLVDTHEHLVEESARLAGVGPLVPCQDFAYLFFFYDEHDLASAGMPQGDIQEKFLSPDVDLDEKWRLFKPYYEKSKNTGYFLASRLSLRELYGEDDLTDESYARISEKMQARVKKGFYKEVIQDIARVESCQVNSLEAVFMESQYPTLLFQDLSFVPMSTRLDVPRLCQESSLPATTLPEWYRIIDWYFEKCGPQAIAVKNQSAYARRLNYEEVEATTAAPIFERYVKGEELSQAETKALQDHLFHYCLARATDFQLPVKLHTGFYAGNNYMPLGRLSKNPHDLCPILSRYANTNFVIMHIGYPYQDEMIALGKHYSNAYIDLCWSWIINPVASVRFLKEMLLAAPSSKVFTFGGDYTPVEPIVGHAKIARRGIAQTVSELIQESWIRSEDAPAIVERIMRGNQHEVFRIAEKSKTLSGRAKEMASG